jgi:hypothetical protein
MDKRRTDNTMAKRRRTDNTMAKRRTDNTMARRKRTDNTMTKRRRTDNTMTRRKRTMIDNILHRKLKIEQHYKLEVNQSDTIHLLCTKMVFDY